MRRFGRSRSWRATVTQIRALEVATLRPFGRSQSWRATVTQIRALEVATLRPFGHSHSWRATVTQIRALPGSLYIQRNLIHWNSFFDRSSSEFLCDRNRPLGAHFCTFSWIRRPAPFLSLPASCPPPAGGGTPLADPRRVQCYLPPTPRQAPRPPQGPPPPLPLLYFYNPKRGAPSAVPVSYC